MASIKDDRGYNQGYQPSLALDIRTNRRCDAIIQKIGDGTHRTILELGCGTGKMSYLLAQRTKAKVMGVDLCNDFIASAKLNYQLANLEYMTLDFNFPHQLKNTQVDFVVGDGILHHLYYNMDQSLKAIHGLLKEGGKMIFWEPNILNPYCFLIFNFSFFRKLAKLEPAEKAFSKNFILKKLKQAHFVRTEVSYKDFLLPNTPEKMIAPIVSAEKMVEQIPLFKQLSQSIFIVGEKNGMIP